MVIKPKQPCSKMCSGRHTGCHAECERYLAFEKEKARYYAECEKEKRGKPSSDGILKSLDRIARQKGRHFTQMKGD